MSGFNFGQIGSIISKYMDTDYIDIKRVVLGQLQTVYVNVPCHISYKTGDNPDPITVATKPINTVIEVYLNRDVDIRNDDYIIMKKASEGNQILHTYSGRCGEPIVEQSRQKVIVVMQSDVSAEPTPIPPLNPTVVRISYNNLDGVSINPSTEQYLDTNTTQIYYPPTVIGYIAKEVYVDGVLQSTLYAEITATKSEYNITFVYAIEDTVSYFRLLLNGIYTKDDGSLANGYYLYKKVPLNLIETTDNSYRIQLDTIYYVHSDTSEIITITKGTKLVLFPSQVYVEVTDIQTLIDSYIITVSKFTPTQDELNAYVTEYYE